MSEIREPEESREPRGVNSSDGNPLGESVSGLSSPSIGAYLRGQRELRGMSVEELAALTRIPIRSLERLEAGYFDDQPDGFVRGFVRTVGVGLGLDPDAAVARMLSEPTGEERHTFDWVNRGPRALIGFALVVVLVLGVLSVREWSHRRASMPRVQSGETVQRRDPVRVLSEAESAIRADSTATERE